VAKLNAANEAYAALKLKEQMVSDSLNVALDANENLEGENSGLRTTVAKGKQLVVASSTISAVRVASNGTERKTRRAKRSDRLNVCITLAENRIADQGDVVLYTKWIAPNGKAVDAPETNMAILANERSNFNGSTAVDYDGSAVEVCIATDRSTTSPVELEPGIYTVAIMTESYVVGTVAVELK
jgi:hypothetical protein